MAWLKASVPQAKDFVVEQAPLVAWEIIAYTRAISIVAVIGGILSIIVASIFCPKFIKIATTSKEDGKSIACGMLSIVIGLGGILGFVHGIAHTNDAIKSIFAPRLVLIEYIADKCK